MADKLSVAKWQRAQNIHLFSGPLYACYQNGMLDWLESWNPDVLIVEANPRYLSTPAALRWMKARNRPVIGWGLGAPPVQGFLRGLRAKQRSRFLAQFDILIAYSRRGADEYRSLGFRLDRIIVAPNSVTPKPVSLPTKRGNSSAQLNVLYVGRLQARKRVGSLLRACAAMPEQSQPHLQIVGEGPALAELKSLAKQIFPQTEFAGPRFGTELDTYFDNADLFVLPGTGGLAVQQAMAHGLAVIVADGDGSQADMVTPANGWLVPPGDEGSLQQTLADAVADPAKLLKMGRASFELVQKTFNLENMADAFVEALNLVSD